MQARFANVRRWLRTYDSEKLRHGDGDRDSAMSFWCVAVGRGWQRDSESDTSVARAGRAVEVQRKARSNAGLGI